MPVYTWVSVWTQQPLSDRFTIVPTDPLSFGPENALWKCTGKRWWRRRSMRVSFSNQSVTCAATSPSAYTPVQAIARRQSPTYWRWSLLRGTCCRVWGSRCSFDALTGFLYESFDYVLHPTMRLLLNRQGFQAELLAPDPAHDRSSHNDAFFDRQIDGQGTRLPNF